MSSDIVLTVEYSDKAAGHNPTQWYDMWKSLEYKYNKHQVMYSIAHTILYSSNV